MKRPRVEIGPLMAGIALLGLPLAILVRAWHGQPTITDRAYFDLGLWPGLVAFPAATILAFRPGRVFWRGFAVLGWAGLLAYLACCRWTPSVVLRALLFYLNEIDFPWATWLIDADTPALTMLNLMVLGLILATPQLMMATFGGLVARWIWGKRWTTT